MIGLIAVDGYIALNVVVIAFIGRRQYGSLKVWWNS